MNEPWITWGLQLLITSVLYVIWKKIEANTEAMVALRLELAGEYLKFKTWDEESKAIRKRLHEIEDWISGQKAVEAMGRLK